jgi:hypothetical protein
MLNGKNNTLDQTKTLMKSDLLSQLCAAYLRTLCVDIPERCVGSEGNRQATQFFRDVLASFG